MVNEAMQKAKALLTGAGFKEKNIAMKIEKKEKRGRKRYNQ